MKLGRGAEFDRIRRFVSDRPISRADVLVGPGDDCAIIRGDRIAVSTDLTIEDVHFRRAWIRPRDVGRRAAIASLSDLAACAAQPIGVLASLAVRPDEPHDFAEQVMASLRETADEYGAELLGGDLSRSTGALILDVVALGHVTTPLLRSGAVPGHDIWVTGRLGGAAVAVRDWLAGRKPAAAAERAFTHPAARVREAVWLAERGLAEAMIDLSDGIAGDAGHMAAASDVCIVLDTDAIPIHESARDRSDALEIALSGGEDYELCFAAGKSRMESEVLEFERAFGIPLTRVGTVTEGKGVLLRDAAGALRPAPMTGYDHFAPVVS